MIVGRKNRDSSNKFDFNKIPTKPGLRSKRQILFHRLGSENPLDTFVGY